MFPGDGTGPEVVREGLKVLTALAEGAAAPWKATEYPGGGQYYLLRGREWEPEAEAAAHRADAILVGRRRLAGRDPCRTATSPAAP